MKLGEKIRKARNEAGVSQGQLAKTLGVTRVSVSQWENSATTPGINRLVDISRALNVPFGYFDIDDETVGVAKEYTNNLKSNEMFKPKKANIKNIDVYWHAKVTSMIFSLIKEFGIIVGPNIGDIIYDTHIDITECGKSESERMASLCAIERGFRREPIRLADPEFVKDGFQVLGSEAVRNGMGKRGGGGK